MRILAKIFTVSLSLMLPSFAFAMNGAHDPTTSGLGYVCSACHKGSAATYLYPAANVCITCHNGTKVGAGQTQISYFDQQDYASVVPDGRVNPKQTSHKWFGPDTVPQAKALPPTDPYSINKYGLNRLGYSGQNLCSRCHAVHNDSQNSDPVDYAQSTVAPYVRSLNTSDQMCLDCHRQRNTQAGGVGTHVVQVSYTSASAKPKVIANAPYQNSTNPTAQMKLKKGLVVCSSCHGVHFADSDSATFDNHSTSKVGGLSQSNGSLLRVSLRGADNNVGTINLCTNCHVKQHSGQVKQHTKSTVIQCVDCHNAHVDDLTGDTSSYKNTPNKYLLRRFMNYSGIKGSVQNLSSYRRIAAYTDADTRWARPDNSGVCQSCHLIPNATQNHSAYISIADGATQITQCRTCHNTNAPHTDAAPAGNCTDCHGQPPQANVVGAPGNNGYASGYTRYTNEATTPHKSHSAASGSDYSYSCNECHNGNTHNSGGTYTDVFKTTTSILASTGGLTPSYTVVTGGGDSTCNNVYCHSKGDGTFKAGQNAVGWNSGKYHLAIIGQGTECTTCHDSNGIATGSHTMHNTTKGYGCVVCHSATVSATTTISDKTKHVNGTKDVAFNGTSVSLTISGSNCATVYCHSNGKGAAASPVPTWGGTAGCGSCHLTSSSATKLSTGAHITHFGSDTTNTTCTNCHASTHINGTIDVSYTGGAGSCATTACHGSITPPTWTATYTSINTCTKCHGTNTTTAITAANRHVVAPSDSSAADVGQVSSNAKTGAHQTHLQYFNNLRSAALDTEDDRCIACHGSIPAAGNHANGSSAPSFAGLSVTGGKTPTFSAGSCSNTYCHNPAGTTLNAANTGTNVAPSWTDAAYIPAGTLKTQAACSNCHKNPWDSGFTSSYSHGTLTPATDCSGCHGHNGDNSGSVNGQRHMDGVKYGNGSCDTCHGYPPVASITGMRVAGNYENAKVQDYAGGAGFHTTHVLKTVKATDGFTPCLPCHPNSNAGYHNQGNGTVSQANVNVNDAADTGFRLQKANQKVYDKASAHTCSNVSCHFKSSPAWY